MRQSTVITICAMTELKGKEIDIMISVPVMLHPEYLSGTVL